MSEPSKEAGVEEWVLRDGHVYTSAGYPVCCTFDDHHGVLCQVVRVPRRAALIAEAPKLAARLSEVEAALALLWEWRGRASERPAKVDALVLSLLSASKAEPKAECDRCFGTGTTFAPVVNQFIKCGCRAAHEGQEGK